MKSLSRILFMLFAFLLSIEMIWFGCEPYERQQLLEALSRDDLAREIQLDPYYPLLSQLYQLRIEDHQRALDDLQQEHPLDSKHERSFSEPHSKDSEIRSHSHNDSAELNWQATGSRYVAKMLCHKPKTQQLNNVTAQKIYKWVDADGRTHFGEKLTSGADSHAETFNVEDLTKQYAALQQEVKLSIEYPNWAGDRFIESEIKKQAKMVHKVLSRYVPKANHRQINLKIILFKTVADFENYRDQQKENAQWGAYYSSASNSIYLPRYPNIEQTMLVARHEMTHAMLAGMLGPIPVWMNEGLAAYMESLSWQMNVAKAQPEVREYNQLMNTSMKRLANTDHQDFNGRSQRMNYLQAAASLYFLLDHQAGQQWLKRSFAFYGQNPCRKATIDQLFGANYPGGIDAASRNFQAWLSDGKFSSHRY
jgi:hypothetical protein